MRSTKIVLLLLILGLMIALADCQRGGGKNNGHDNGHNNNGHNNHQSSYESCRRSCQSRGDYSQVCVDNCVRSGSGGGGGGGGGFGMFILLFCCGIPILCFLCCAMCTGAIRNQEQPHDSRHSGQQQHHSCHAEDDSQTFGKLVSKYNYPVSPALSRENFQAATNMFFQLIGRSGASGNFQVYTNDSQFTTKAQATPIQDRSSQPYAKNFSLRGDDILGAYSCRGSIVCTETGMLVWFMKTYDDRDAAGQTGEWRDLIYESSYFQPDGIEGKWYYAGFEFNPEYSGRWTLRSEEWGRPIEMQNIGQRIAMTDNDLTRPLNNGW